MKPSWHTFFLHPQSRSHPSRKSSTASYFEAQFQKDQQWSISVKSWNRNSIKILLLTSAWLTWHRHAHMCYKIPDLRGDASNYLFYSRPAILGLALYTSLKMKIATPTTQEHHIIKWFFRIWNGNFPSMGLMLIWHNFPSKGFSIRILWESTSWL